METTFAFTPPKVAALAVDKATGRLVFFDSKLTGLAIRVSHTGRKVWEVGFRIDGQFRRKDLGLFPAVTLADARQLAQEALLMAARGEDPRTERRERRAALTFAKLAEEYLEKHAKPNKRTWRSDHNILHKDAVPAWRHRKVTDLKRRDVIALLDDVAARAPIQANRTLACVRKVFNWAVSRDLMPSNPCAQVTAPSHENSRDRVLSDDELRAIWKALEGLPPAMADAIRLMLLTAQRKGEVMPMAWADVDLASGWWTVSSEDAKNALSHRVPLTAPVTAILERWTGKHPTWVLPSPKRQAQPVSNPSNAMDKLRAECKVDFRLHDLRRTAASRMASLGVSRLVIGKVLNHLEPGVTKVYDRHSYDAEKRAALEAWSECLTGILAAKSET